MNKPAREKAIKLRIEKQLSYGEIAKRLCIPKSTLSYWLRDFPLSNEKIIELRRKNWRKGEASRERFRNTMRVKRESKLKETYQKQKALLRPHVQSKGALYIAGLALYLGEGNKKDNYTVALSNTNPAIIRFFVRWLERFLGIPRFQIKVQLHLYENMDIENERKFWQNILGFKSAQFYKAQIRKLQANSFLYKESFRHGTCQVIYHSGDKKMALLMAMEAFVDLFLGDKENMRV